MTDDARSLQGYSVSCMLTRPQGGKSPGQTQGT